MRPGLLDLMEHEKVVEQNRLTTDPAMVAEVKWSLERINDDHLYRAAGYESMAGYLYGRWGLWRNADGEIVVDSIPQATDGFWMREPDGTPHLMPRNPSMALTYTELRASFAEQFRIIKSPGLLRVNKINLGGDGAVRDVKRALRQVGFVDIVEQDDCITGRKR